MGIATKPNLKRGLSEDVGFTDISSTNIEDFQKITSGEMNDEDHGRGEELSPGEVAFPSAAGEGDEPLTDTDSDPSDSVPSSSTPGAGEGEHGEGFLGPTGRKQPKLIANKTCLVCGDAALGKNFGAVSCESCKAFFRRNALKNVFGRCEGQCDVSIENRSYCKRCRMTKCLEIGMKREMLITQQRKRRKPPKEINGQGTTGIVKKTVLNLDALTPKAPKHLSNGLDLICRKPYADDSEKSPISNNPDVFDATGRFKSWENARNYSLSAAIPISVIEHIPKEVQYDIDEVITAFDISFDKSHVNPSLPSSPDSFEIHELMGGSIKKLVKMGKHLKRFQWLRRDDQIMLLKGGIVEILVLRSVSNYHPQSASWFVPKAPNAQQHNFVQAKGLNMGYDVQTQDMFTTYNRFVQSVQRLLRGDSIILMLLIVIALFSADRVVVKETDKVDQCQEYYARVLEIYCRQLYPTKPQIFPKSLVLLMELRSIHEIQTKMLAKLPVEKLEPLIKEIFDV